MPRIRECHHELLESAVTERVIGAFYAVYNELGYGYLESVYKNALAVEIGARGLAVRSEVPIEVVYRGVVVGSFRADMVVEERVVVELKAGKLLPPESELQLLNYLRGTELEIGLLFHFGPRPAFKRKIWTTLPRTRSDPSPSAGSGPSAFRSSSPSKLPTTSSPPPSPGPCLVPPPAAYPTP